MANVRLPTIATTSSSEPQPVGFLREDNDNYSTMRLMSFIALISAIFFRGYTIAKCGVKSQGIH